MLLFNTHKKTYFWCKNTWEVTLKGKKIFLRQKYKHFETFALFQLSYLIFPLRNCIRRWLVIIATVIGGCRVGCSCVGRRGCVSCGSRIGCSCSISSCRVSRCSCWWPCVQGIISSCWGICWGIVSGISCCIFVIFLLCLVVSYPHFHVKIHMGVSVILGCTFLLGIQQINPGREKYLRISESFSSIWQHTLWLPIHLWSFLFPP